jgi:hypothetical protein
VLEGQIIMPPARFVVILLEAKGAPVLVPAE